MHRRRGDRTAVQQLPHFPHSPVGGGEPLGQVGAIGLELVVCVASAEAQVEPPVADLVHHHGLLGDLNGQAQRGQHNAVPILILRVRAATAAANVSGWGR